MVTLHALGISTSSYAGDTAIPECDDEDEHDDTVEDQQQDEVMPFENITVDSNTHTGKPLLFMYDCETTGGSFYQDHIMEIGSAVIAPDGVSISNHEFSSLCHTSRHIVRKGLIVVYQLLFFIVIAIIVSEKCGITARDLYNQPNFSTVLKNFIKWIQECLQEAQQEQDYYPRKLL